MTKRAQNIINQTYGNRITPAIAALVEFAAQNSGLNLADYAGDYKAYRIESRDINHDWQRFKSALAVASAEGVTDKEVIAAAPGAFSGRLAPVAKVSVWPVQQTCKVKSATLLNDLPAYVLEYEGKASTMLSPVVQIAWDYCAGQYFPTEYRKAAATVLEAAIRAVRQARPPEHQTVKSIAELKALNEKNGGCWFEPSTMRFFGTKIESGIIRGRYFISSEQQDEDKPRKFTVRSFNDEGDVDTVGKFHAYETKAEAIAAIPTETKSV